jgi:hypothetical protein
MPHQYSNIRSVLLSASLNGYLSLALLTLIVDQQNLSLPHEISQPRHHTVPSSRPSPSPVRQMLLCPLQTINNLSNLKRWNGEPV